MSGGAKIVGPPLNTSLGPLKASFQFDDNFCQIKNLGFKLSIIIYINKTGGLAVCHIFSLYYKTQSKTLRQYPILPVLSATRIVHFVQLYCLCLFTINKIQKIPLASLEWLRLRSIGWVSSVGPCSQPWSWSQCEGLVLAQSLIVEIKRQLSQQQPKAQLKLQQHSGHKHKIWPKYFMVLK